MIRDGAATDELDLTAELDPGVQAVSSFGQDASGELYVVSHQGAIFRIEPE